jgi:tetratricopeptide (TPR) repeat protein
MLTEWYRFETSKTGGVYDPEKCDELIGIIRDFARKHPEPGIEVGWMLGCEGSSSEKTNDYESALKFYKASLGFPVSDPNIRYFRLNNLGFCLNFFRKFDEAEEFLRAAVVMEPGRYNAWKNLGVTLEHQKKYEEAAECYLKAVRASRGEPRSIGHYRRLLDRQPVLYGKFPEIENEE